MVDNSSSSEFGLVDPSKRQDQHNSCFTLKKSRTWSRQYVSGQTIQLHHWLWLQRQNCWLRVCYLLLELHLKRRKQEHCCRKYQSEAARLCIGQDMIFAIPKIFWNLCSTPCWHSTPFTSQLLHMPAKAACRLALQYEDQAWYSGRDFHCYWTMTRRACPVWYTFPGSFFLPPLSRDRW